MSTDFDVRMRVYEYVASKISVNSGGGQAVKGFRWNLIPIWHNNISGLLVLTCAP